MLALFTVLIALSAIELLTRRVEWSSRAINLQAWVVNVAAMVLFMPLVQYSVPVSLISDVPLWLSVPLFVLIMDLGEYLFHRAQHASPLLWRMHSLHHSDHDMNATTTNRHFWGDSLLKAVTIWPLAAFVVAPTPAATTIFAALSLWNFLSHSAIDLNFGKWSWVINSPAYHRRHHSIQPEHYDSNFAALFPIFDVIAGSYHRPDGFPPTGLDERPEHVGDVLIWPLRGLGVPSKRPATADRPAL